MDETRWILLVFGILALLSGPWMLLHEARRKRHQRELLEIENASRSLMCKVKEP